MRRKTTGMVHAQVFRVVAPVAELATALDAELAVSALLGGAYAAADVDAAAAVTRFADGFIRYAAKRGDRVAHAVLSGLAVVAPAEVAGDAQTAVAELRAAGVPPPPWAAQAGQVRCTGTWAVRDEYGDQTEYIAAFAYADEVVGGIEHAVCVLADHNLGYAKDLIAGASAGTVLASWRSSAAADPGMALAEIDAAELRSGVTAALAGTDMLAPVLDTSAVSEERSFVLSRIATLPDGATPAPPKLTDEQRAEVIAGFLTAPEVASHSAPRAVLAACARAIVDYACDENSGDPLRWSPMAVELFLHDWAPRRADLDAVAAERLPDVLDAFVAYAGRRKGLREAAVQASRDAISRGTPPAPR